MDARELASGHREIARPAGAPGQDQRVEIAAQGPDVHVDTDVGARAEDDAFLLHDLQPAVDEALLHLELGDAVAQEAPDPVVTLEDRDQVTGPIELLGGGEAGRPRAHRPPAPARARGPARAPRRPAPPPPRRPLGPPPRARASRG